MTTKKKDVVATLRGKLGAAERRANENMEFYLKHEKEQHALTLCRNDLAWIVLDAIEVLGLFQYERDPVLRMVKAGMEARLEKALPGFQAEIQAEADRMAEMHAKADAAERMKPKGGE